MMVITEHKANKKEKRLAFFLDTIYSKLSALECQA